MFFDAIMYLFCLHNAPGNKFSYENTPEYDTKIILLFITYYKVATSENINSINRLD